MQTLTFLQKASPALRSRSSIWAVVAILLTLFGGKALAQPTGTSTASLRNVFVTYGTTSSSTTGTYNAIPTTGGTNASGTIFANTDFGSYDVNTGRLLLQGGTVEITEANGEVYDRAYIGYAVGAGSLASGPNPAFTGAQQIELVQTGYNSGTSVRTFSLSNAARNILALATAGNTNRFDITVNATGTDGNGDPVSTAGTGSRRRSQFTATGTPSTATVNPNNIQLAADGTSSSTSYYFPNTGTTPQFPGYNFCSNQNAGGTNCAFDINNGQLRLTNTTITTTETGQNTITSAVLYYRVRSTSSGGGAFQPITLSQSGATSGGVRTFIIDPSSTSNSNPQPNLISASAVTAVGNYAIDVYYQASGVNSSTGTPFTVTYPPTGYSTATFTVGGTPVAVTIWTGAINDNWFDSGNWTNGIPNPSTNALIRDLGTGNSVPYPNIRSDFRYVTAGGALIYDNTGSGPAQTLNFTMGGSSQAARSIARLVVGQLRVFGTFDNSYDSFIQRDNTIMEFAGGNQNITGGSFVRVDISGGGTKTLQGVMNISESLNFLTPNVYTSADIPRPATNVYATLSDNAGVLTTDITQPSTNVVFLADRATQNQNNGAQINGETDNAYLYGFIRTTRASVVVGETRTYGNMGMTLTFTGANDPNNVEVTRNTVEAYSPVANVYGVRRIFGVRPSNQTTNNGGLNANMVFRYRNAETKRLNGATTRSYGTGRIQEQNLTIFVSSNSGNTFTLVGRDAAPDTVNNTVTRTGVRTFATFTLGDVTNPLPVQLVAFNAARSGSGALLTWTTASELNNKGFNVQVSTDGVEYRTVSFVASQSPNSATVLNYKYTDTESSSQGLAYYRLQQVDFSGKVSYSPVRVIDFSGIDKGGLALAVYPNPFLDSDQVSMTLAGSVNGTAQVTILDVAGHTVASQQMPVTGGSLILNNLGSLNSGTYLARVTLADGTSKTVRLQKK